MKTLPGVGIAWAVVAINFSMTPVGMLFGQDAVVVREGPSPYLVEPTPMPKSANARLGHFSYPVSVLAFSADGKIVATGHNHNIGGLPAAILLWDTKSGKHLHTLNAHTINVMSAAFSSDGKLLATGGMDNTLHFWDVATGKPTNPVGLKFRGHVYALAFGADNLTLIVGNNGLSLVDVQKHEVVKNVSLPGSSFCFNLLLSPDAKRMVCVGDRDIYYMAVPDLAPRHLPIAKANLLYAREFAFAADGKRLLHFAYQDRALWRWNEETLQAVLKNDGPGSMTRGELPDPKNVDHAFAFTPDGLRSVHVYARESDGVMRHTLVVSDTRDRKEIRRIDTPCRVSSLRVSPDGKTLAMGGQDGSLRLWELDTGKLQRLLLDNSPPVVSIHPKGKNLLALTNDGSLHTWNLDTLKEAELHRLQFPAFHPLKRLSSDRSSMLTVERDGSLHVWDTQTGKRRWSIAKALEVLPPLPRLVFDKGGDKEKELSPEQKRRKEAEEAKTPPDVRVAFSTEDRWVVGRTAPNQITFWDTGTGKVGRQIALKSGIQAWTLTRDGKNMVVASMESYTIEKKAKPRESIVVVDLASGKEVRRLSLPAHVIEPLNEKFGPSEWFADALILAPDDKTLAVVEKIVTPGRRVPTIRREIRIWDMTQFKQLDHIAGPTNGVVAFSPDGKRLAYGAMDQYYHFQNVGVWDLHRRTLVTLPGDRRDVAGISFMSNTTLAAFGQIDRNHPGQGGTILVWEVDKLNSGQK